MQKNKIVFNNIFIYILYFLFFHSFSPAYSRSFYSIEVNSPDDTLNGSPPDLNNLPPKCRLRDALLSVERLSAGLLSLNNCPATPILDLPPSSDTITDDLYFKKDVIQINLPGQPILLNGRLEIGTKPELDGIRVKIMARHINFTTRTSDGIIDGKNLHPLFRIGAAKPTVEFNGIVLRNGFHDGKGAGVMLESKGAIVSFINVIAHHHRATSGAIIYNQGTIHIRQSLFTDGRAWNGNVEQDSCGGLIENRGLMFIFGQGSLFDAPFDPLQYSEQYIDNPFYYTQLTNGAAARGGIICNSGTLSIRNVHLSKGFAGTLNAPYYTSFVSSGGHIYNDGGNLGISISLLDNGVAIGPGSSIYNHSGVLEMNRFAIKDGKSYRNIPAENNNTYAPQDGAITSFQGDIVLTQGTLASNQSCDISALNIMGAEMGSTIANMTIKENKARCASILAVKDMQPTNPPQDAPPAASDSTIAVTAASGSSDVVGGCTTNIFGDAYDFRFLLNTFVKNSGNLADICIDNFYINYELPKPNNAPPDAGLWVGGNLFSMSPPDDTGNVLLPCLALDSANKPYVYFVNNIEWGVSSTTCQRGSSPVTDPLYTETTNQIDPILTDYSYGTFGGFSYRPKNSLTHFVIQEICNDPSVNLGIQSDPNYKRTIPCSAGSEE